MTGVARASYRTPTLVDMKFTIFVENFLVFIIINFGGFLCIIFRDFVEPLTFTNLNPIWRMKKKILSSYKKYMHYCIIQAIPWNFTPKNLQNIENHQNWPCMIIPGKEIQMSTNTYFTNWQSITCIPTIT